MSKNCMSDMEIAMSRLAVSNVVLCRNGKVIERTERGILPLLKLIKTGEDFSGFSAADKIIGKAAALLFLKMGICEVYGEVMSIAAQHVFEKSGVHYKFQTLAEKIINRAGTGRCPMEEAVAITDDPDIAYQIILETYKKLFEE